MRQKNCKYFFSVLLFIMLSGSSAWASPKGLEQRISSLVDFIGGLLGNQPKVVKKVVLPYDYYVRQAARRYGLDPCIVHSIIRQESNYNPRAVSAKGARGLMQLMPGTAREMGVSNIFNPRQNINGGTKYYARLLGEFITHKKALTAYNFGPARVRKGLSCNESRKYVKKVLRTWHHLHEHYQYK